MKTEKKILSLVNHGFKPSTLLKLNENQINLLHSKLLESKKENKEAVTKTSTTTTFDPSNDTDRKALEDMLGKKGVPTTVDPATKKVTVVSEEGDVDDVDDENALGKDSLQSYTGQELPHDANDMSPDGMDDDSDNDREMMGMSEEIDFLMGVDEEMNEKFESKAQQGLFWARCNKCSDKNCKWCKMAKEFSKSTSKKQYEKMPEKIHPEKTVKYKKKETKESYIDMISKGVTNNYRLKLDDIIPGINYGGMSEEKLEKNIMKLVEKHILPKMSKKDLLSFISEQGTKEKEKERTKEKEKEKTPSTPYKPKPGPKPNPKAKKTEVDEQEIAPVKTPPKTKPTTKPNKPGTPYSPKPGPKPAPKAGKNELPNWLSFSKIGINLK
jgi:hypothetical protein